MKNTFSLNFIQNMRKKLNKHETLFKTVDLRDQNQLPSYIYGPFSKEAGLLLLMRESFILYILYKFICIQFLCDNKGSACIVTALSYCN